MLFYRMIGKDLYLIMTARHKLFNLGINRTHIVQGHFRLCQFDPFNLVNQRRQLQILIIAADKVGLEGETSPER